jgi:photosystem II stability/assembly factor-like uncharacterized protein
MRKNTLLACLLAFWAATLSAQQKPTPIFVAPDAPAWVQMLQAEQPNVFDVQAAYHQYYREHPFEKNSYTQYYKRWMRWARTRTQPDGSLAEPSVAQQAAREHQLRQLRQAAVERSGSSANWNFVGPKQTFDTDGSTVVSWQTNIYAVDIAPSDPNILYAGGETGGIWKTTNKGLNWTLLTSDVLHSGIGAVKIHPTDPNTVYAGTNGKVIKTTDGGQNWSTVYSEADLWVNAIAIKPDAPNTVLAAADQGLLRSTDGGATWNKAFTQTTWDVDFKPGSPNTVFAIRKNGSGSNFRISTDGGANWVNGSMGWWTPSAGLDVTGAHIATCPSNPDKVYAYLCGEGGTLKGYIGVFVSTDSGTSWANTHPGNAIGNSPTAYSIPNHTNLMTNNGLFSGFSQGFYDMALIVNPTNDNELIAGGTSWFKSTDGGRTWNGLGGYVGTLEWSHPDIQAIAVAGSDLWIASDGGLDYSSNFGQSITARMNGISGADLWGFDAGWNEDVLVGGRYHNGNMAWHQSFPEGKFYRMGGAESPTGYVNPGDARKTYFSDIGGYRLKGGFGDGANAFSVGRFPNESYAYYANSEMAWDPRCWNIVYIGQENKIWKSTDGGTSYALLYTFPGSASNEVYEIEVCRANPEVLYCSQWNGTDDAMWRSENGGQSWSALTPLPLPNNNDRVKMAVSAEDEDILWVAVTYGSNGRKIYKSTDGGQSWTNLTTNLLNNVTIANIMAQYGTDGGIYLGTNAGVFYRNNSHSDWQPYSTGLPLSAETNRLKPFYRDGKIRNGCWGFGVWETELFEPSQVIAQPIASALQTDCQRDTVYFDDYSVVRHDANTNWSWAFSPAPQYVSATNVRNPKVVFGAAGQYTATMTLNGTHQKSLVVKVTEGCSADTIPGQAAVLGGNVPEDYVSLPPLGITTNKMTISAWVKISGIQPDYSGIFIHDGTTAGFNFRPGDNSLGYHWPSGSWGWNSGLIVPQNQWTHVAMVVEPTGVTLYLNGRASKHSFSVPTVNFEAGNRIGNYQGWGGRYMNGMVDEVCVFNTNLSQAQIRELMHLTKDPAEFPNLLAYYQFNEVSGRVLDRSGTRHAALTGGSASRSTSTAPVGKGSSARQTVTAAGTYAFGGTGLELTFPSGGSYPNGELCVSRINQAPDQLPAALPRSTGYWVVNNFGSNSTFSTLSALRFNSYGPFGNDAVSSSFQLYKRGSFADGNTWGSPIDQGDASVPGANGQVLFSSGNGVNAFSQFVILYNGLLPVEWQDFRAALEDNRRVRLQWSVYQRGTARFVVEKSADGIDFQAIGEVEAKAADGQHAYEWADQQPFKGHNYYRIRELATDGRSQLSGVRSVLVLALADEWTLWPNPAQAGQLLHIGSVHEAPYRFRLFDASGKMVVEGIGENQLDLLLPATLPAGLYSYEIAGERRRVQGKLVLR